MAEYVKLICHAPEEPILFAIVERGDERAAAEQIAMHRQDFECNDRIEFQDFMGW